MSSYPLITIDFVTYPTILIKGIPIQTTKTMTGQLVRFMKMLRQLLRYNSYVLAAYQCLS